jgi:hypothetical protein
MPTPFRNAVSSPNPAEAFGNDEMLTKKREWTLNAARHLSKNLALD